VQRGDTRSLGRILRPRATLQQIADRAGCSYSLVAKVSRGERRPNDRIKAAVEEILHVPWREVFPDSQPDE
jgi:transcriptional regulator with XRE-family HTH domain